MIADVGAADRVQCQRTIRAYASPTIHRLDDPDLAIEASKFQVSMGDVVVDNVGHIGLIQLQRGGPPPRPNFLLPRAVHRLIEPGGATQPGIP